MVVPTKLQERVVELAHQGHQGMVKTKRLIREKVWFPGIDALEGEELHGLSSQHISTGIVEDIKATGVTMATC